MQALGNGVFTADIDSTPLASGPFTFYVRARDTDGNASVMPRTLTVANPTAQPTGTIDASRRPGCDTGCRARLSSRRPWSRHRS